MLNILVAISQSFGHVSGEGSRLRAIIPAELRTRVKGSKIKLYPKRVYLFELSGERIK